MDGAREGISRGPGIVLSDEEFHYEVGGRRLNGSQTFLLVVSQVSHAS